MLRACACNYDIVEVGACYASSPSACSSLVNALIMTVEERWDTRSANRILINVAGYFIYYAILLQWEHQALRLAPSVVAGAQ
jgi:hypothetical protein